jgi:hypothetical protein
MANTTPFHSVKPGTAYVYHNDTRCTEGNNIERLYWRSGTGVGRHLCAHCTRLQYTR